VNDRSTESWFFPAGVVPVIYTSAPPHFSDPQHAVPTFHGSFCARDGIS
jgi:hypothetical protein